MNRTGDGTTDMERARAAYAITILMRGSGIGGRNIPDVPKIEAALTPLAPAVRTVSFDSVTFDTQQRIMRETAIFFAPHGAALANVAFM